MQGENLRNSRFGQLSNQGQILILASRSDRVDEIEVIANFYEACRPNRTIVLVVHKWQSIPNQFLPRATVRLLGGVCC